MKLICESFALIDYLEETDEVDYSHLSIKEKAVELYSSSLNEDDFVRRAYEYVRDEIAHSWDIQSSRVTCKASETLYFREGICYAKANLLCAILRSRGVPAGFCYQRLTLGETPDTGYCIHALNAAYLKSIKRWVRMDARGNKEGVDAQFSKEEEKLAFSVREEYDERDYPTIYRMPNLKTIQTLKNNTDCIKMFSLGLPSEL